MSETSRCEECGSPFEPGHPPVCTACGGNPELADRIIGMRLRKKARAAPPPDSPEPSAHPSHRWVTGYSDVDHDGYTLCGDCGVDIDDDEALEPCAGARQDILANWTKVTPEFVALYERAVDDLVPATEDHEYGSIFQRVGDFLRQHVRGARQGDVDERTSSETISSWWDYLRDFVEQHAEDADHEALLVHIIARLRAHTQGDAPREIVRELLCEMCGRDYPVWFADNDLWNAVMRRGDRANDDEYQFVCPTCFVMKGTLENTAPHVFHLTIEGGLSGGDARDEDECYLESTIKLLEPFASLIMGDEEQAEVEMPADRLRLAILGAYGNLLALRARLAQQPRTAWVRASPNLKACPNCGSLTLEGFVACSECGCEPDDDSSWRYSNVNFTAHLPPANEPDGAQQQPEGEREPMQPVVVAEDGYVRFRKNTLVRHLLDFGPFDMNDLAMIDASPEDRMQFAQLIGYSINGYGELSYVTDESYERAERVARVLAPDPREGERTTPDSDTPPAAPEPSEETNGTQGAQEDEG